ncbi:MAG: hypothetical protein D6734_00505 [Candidatus Schekmanbacteria bacterium]|nr:MAG: hypothetical protein D6734_00505 [Candidatus Schekmanbacteria bacterium]
MKSINSFDFKRNLRKYLNENRLNNLDFLKKYESIIIDGIKHYRVKYDEQRRRALDSAESFWSYVKRRLSKFNGIPKKAFYLHLKESEFRYNEKDKIYEKLLKIWKKF